MISGSGWKGRKGRRLGDGGNWEEGREAVEGSGRGNG